MTEEQTAAAFAPLDERPDLTACECHVLVTWLNAETVDDALQELGITQRALNEYLRSVRDKYAALGRPARTSAMLMDRVIEDLTCSHQKDALLNATDFATIGMRM